MYTNDDKRNFSLFSTFDSDGNIYKYIYNQYLIKNPRLISGWQYISPIQIVYSTIRQDANLRLTPLKPNSIGPFHFYHFGKREISHHTSGMVASYSLD
jgi:hypothetical protein